MTGRQVILVVDDEPRIQRFVRANLKAAGYDVLLAATAAEAIDACEQHDPDLLLLDLGLPDMDGMDLFVRLRSFSETPVIMLTARDSSPAKIRGLDLGADDYIVKPFDVDELLARIRAVLRRSIKGGGNHNPVLEVGALKLDVAHYEAWAGDEPLHLTPTEFKLLAHLAAHAGKVVLHEDLLSHVWGPEYRDAVEYLRVTVLHIRQKLSGSADLKQMVQTVPGVGYKLSLL
ncbi:MAG: response regulator receiver [Symbiobacteriaceae bacterium]|jgi:two-component system KDP operon response regulator KdpE|nr:response regulator receiver [Symbiobacteriaceae bacterium]